ncbi:MAG: DUF1830 domain-containing protein [Cyanobacteria bacterium P01_D01_bin.115]
MSQIIDAVPTHYPNKILYGHQNISSHLQVMKITNIPHWYFERVVFPGEIRLFEAMPEAIPEIYDGNGVTGVLCQQIACNTLRLQTFLNSNL